MKALSSMMLAFMILTGPGSVLFGAEAADAVSDHEKMAASYEEKAAAQDALIREHTKMKEDYQDRFFVNEKVTPMATISGMEEHCDAIIDEARNLKTKLLEFAKWHRMRASELQGL